jgi:hypothetical protein
VSIVIAPDTGAAVELVAAAANHSILQNAGGFGVVVENLADPVAGITLKPGAILELGDTAWTAAWNAKSLSGFNVPIRVSLVGPAPPTGINLQADLPSAGQITWSFTANPAADTTDVRYRVDDGAWTEVIGSGSPQSVDVSGTSTQTVDLQARSVLNTEPGPWSDIISDVFA